MSWRFTDQYLTQYPALENSILSVLVFSQNSLNGTEFTGTIDVVATGSALSALGAIVDLSQIAVSGTVTDTGETLTVSLESTDAGAFQKGLANNIPLIGGSVTQAATLTIETVTNANDDPGNPIPTDKFDLNVILGIGSTSVDLVTQVPMGPNGGFFSIVGTFTGVGITLEDIGFLMGSLSDNNKWFPSEQLGPYSAGKTSFGLLGLTLVCYLTLTPSLNISISSITASVGISALSLKPNALYMNPLAVWVTVVNPTGSPTAHWGLEGSAQLYNNSAPGGPTEPDFTFDFAMGFPDSTNPNFSISGQLENPSSKPVVVMLQDLLGASTDLGIDSALTVNAFEIVTDADVRAGTISDFSFSVTMSGGFGLFEQFDLESISVAVSYTG